MKRDFLKVLGADEAGAPAAPVQQPVPEPPPMPPTAGLQVCSKCGEAAVAFYCRLPGCPMDMRAARSPFPDRVLP